MIRKILFIFVLAFCSKCVAQYQFNGQIAKKGDSKIIYLSIIEDYRKLSRISLEQIFKKTETDSLGNFKFEGDNLSQDNRIYRIHIDECSAVASGSNHFFGTCENSSSILFIANNNDSISFPTSFTDEVLCQVNSTNDKSSAFLEIDFLKDEMAFDFNDFRSAASRKLNSKKWFSAFQSFGQQLDEPLAELYIFDFLSDKRNETYGYYLKDIANNSYYSELSERLETEYPNTEFTKLYQEEIATDQQLASQRSPSSSLWRWILGGLLILSILLNVILMMRQKSIQQKHRDTALEKLTAQEQKIVDEILKDKTNKEIASDLFISVSTVKTHINNLYKKLNATSREEIKQRFQGS